MLPRLCIPIVIISSTNELDIGLQVLSRLLGSWHGGSEGAADNSPRLPDLCARPGFPQGFQPGGIVGACARSYGREAIPRGNDAIQEDGLGWIGRKNVPGFGT